MYKFCMFSTGSHFDLENAMNVINNDHGVIQFVESNRYNMYIIYEVEGVGS
jgi:hypothetical protein